MLTCSSSSTSSSLKTCFHTVAFSFLSYTFFLSFDTSYGINAIFSHLGGRANFLTIWGLVLTLIAFTINLLVDLFPHVLLFRELKKILNVLAFSIESLVTSLYWPILFYNPALIASVIEYIPIGQDLAYHLYPILFLLIENFYFSDKITRSNWTLIRFSNGTKIQSLILIILTTLAYVSRIEFTHMKNDIPLPYPFLQLVSFKIRILIYLSTASMAYSFIFIAEKILINSSF